MHFGPGGFLRLAIGVIFLAAGATQAAQAEQAEQGPAWRDRMRERIEQRQQRPPRATPSDLQELAVSHQGMTRTVLVHVPAGVREGTTLPLVVALHGGGGFAAYMADDERYGLNRKADSAGFLVVYPNGYSRLPGGKFATWNAGNCCGDARDRAIDDVGFLREVVATVQRRHPVDAQRIFAVGMSNGGMMSYRLACEAADVFRAVASVAGTEGVAACRPSKPVSVLHIHARNDDHVLFDGGAGAGAFRDRSKVTEFVSVPETIRRWVERAQCRGTPERVLEVPGAYCEKYAACADRQSVQLCVTSDGGHSWPGAAITRRGKESPSQALDANDRIWTFFSSLAPR
ncbi:extracellular catalytic domain type 1 short-chain-length polyhydroxyalkanoate depolymerase [Aquabacterium humicola]|uniref:extracellular catalytic domain type 1 short-chain-length polyhydroxyalkanoate depolymerase n=1 Tax=Aquabacterium humicola TaxID=3237377 RepID=UPI002543C37E|nr:PHB depolymerase family esterase [Rubrivivax pictus]